MRLFSTLLCFSGMISRVVAIPPPEHTRVLVVLDPSNDEFDASTLSEPLVGRGFDVTVKGVKDHPKLVEFGERVVDNLLIVPGKVKALGSTLKASHIIDFMKLGGNVVILTTPKYSPIALRDTAAQLGINVSGRGVVFQNNFGHDPTYPVPSLLQHAELGGESSVAKIGANPLLLGLVQAPYSSYAWNSAREDEEPVGLVSDIFGQGSELYLGVAAQTLNNARFVWVGSSEILKNPQSAAELTGWAFQEQGKLRVVKATHEDAKQQTHLQYSVEENLKYCAEIEQWVPEVNGWIPYSGIKDVQLEFKMLDPYYRLNLDSNGCVEFKTPEQYGMFTFSLDYKRPALSFLSDNQVVTIRHRANDEWTRSWSITNSWVYLSGVGLTVIAFLVFVIVFSQSPIPVAPKEAPVKAAESPSKEAAVSSKSEKTGKKPKSKKSKL